MIVGGLLLSTAAHDSAAECQPNALVSELKVMTEIEYYSFSDEYVIITGTVRKDAIIAGESVTLLINMPGEQARSEITTVNPADGSFSYRLLLDATDEKRFGRYNVTASYASFVANWSFIVSTGIVDLAGAQISRPRLHTPDGNPISDNEILLGRQVILSTEIKNPWDWRDQPVVAIMEVRDGNGVTVYLGLQSRVLKPDCSAEFGFSWIAGEQGNYQIRSFALSSWIDPRALSEVTSRDVVVVESEIRRGV
jgi:hypothetical protein